MTGGMLSQQQSVRALIDDCHAAGKLVAVGGCDATSSPHVYADADFLILGEGKTVIGEFADAWLRGGTRGRFEAEKFATDMSLSPVPRFDLIDTDKFLQVGIQFS
jgi:radical SAM superfamily enzyme YgiQ (UPF0313 family)